MRFSASLCLRTGCLHASVTPSPRPRFSPRPPQAEEPQVETGRLPRVHARDGRAQERRAGQAARDQGRAGAAAEEGGAARRPWPSGFSLRPLGGSDGGGPHAYGEVAATARRLRAAIAATPSPPIRHRRDPHPRAAVEEAARGRGRGGARRGARGRRARATERAARVEARGPRAARRGAAVDVRERRGRRGRGAAGPAPVAAAAQGAVGVGARAVLRRSKLAKGPDGTTGFLRSRTIKPFGFSAEVAEFVPSFLPAEPVYLLTIVIIYPPQFPATGR